MIRRHSGKMIGVLTLIVIFVSSVSVASAAKKGPTVLYVANTLSSIYHLPSCSLVKSIDKSVRLDLYDDKEVRKGEYKPCVTCKPDQWAEQQSGAFKATAALEKLKKK